jgi:hypothetical protein
MPEVGLALGAFRATVTASEPAVIDATRRRYAGFLVDGPTDWSLRIEVGLPETAPRDGVVVKRNGAPDRFDLSRYDFAGRIDLDRRVADVTIAEAHELTLDSFLRVMLSLALLPARGLLVHAASVVRGGRGYLFPGVSGAGKTTLCRLSTDATLLSDELSIVSTSIDGPTVHGTPFWGELARAGEAGTAALSGIYFLRHAPRHAVTPLGERAALTRLLPTVMSFAREPDVVARVLDLAADLVAAVPCFVLDFRRDPGFWEAIERG